MQQTTAHSIAWYGASGTYKTTQVCSFALYVYEKIGRSTRLVSAETAGVEPLTPYIDAGIIQPLWLHTGLFPRSALIKVQKGMWDPHIDPATRKPNWHQTEPEEWKKIGAYAFEGLTSIAELLRLDLMQRQAAPNKPGETGISGAGYREEDEVFGVASMGQYGAAQDDIMRLLKECPKGLFSLSGGNVRYLAFTAHESKGRDDVQGKGKTIYGPGVVGSAATDKVQKEVGTLLHAEEGSEKIKLANGTMGVKKSVKYYFTSHPDSENENILWQAKPRIPATGAAVAALTQKWAGGYFEPTTLDHPSPTGIREFLKFQDQLQVQAAAGLTQQIAKMNEAKTTTTTTNK